MGAAWCGLLMGATQTNRTAGAWPERTGRSSKLWGSTEGSGSPLDESGSKYTEMLARCSHLAREGDVQFCQVYVNVKCLEIVIKFIFKKVRRRTREANRSEGDCVEKTVYYSSREERLWPMKWGVGGGGAQGHFKGRVAGENCGQELLLWFLQEETGRAG